MKIPLVATFQIKSRTCYFFWRALGVQEPDRQHPPVFGINPLPPQFHQLSAVVDGTPCREPRGLLSGTNAIPRSWGQLDHQGRCPCDRGIANFPRGLPLPSRQAAFPRRLAVQLHRSLGLRLRAVSCQRLSAPRVATNPSPTPQEMTQPSDGVSCTPRPSKLVCLAERL